MIQTPLKHPAIVRKLLARRYDSSTLGNVRATQHLNKSNERKHTPLLRVGGRELFGGNCLQVSKTQRSEESKQARAKNNAAKKQETKALRTN